MNLWKKLFRPPTRDEFGQLMIRALRDGGVTGPIDYDPAQFCLTFENKDSGCFYLHNAFNDYTRCPRIQQKKVLQSYAALRTRPISTGADFTSAKPHILPKVRERYFHEALRLMSQKDGKTEGDFCATHPLSEDLTVELIQDFPDRIATLGKKTLADWKVDFDQVLPIARDNLWKISNADPKRVAPGLYVSTWNDTHDASRLFLHDLIWQWKVTGDHVAMVPNRNVLIVTGSQDTDGLQKMAALAGPILNEPRPMTGIAVKLTGSKWSSWLPPEDSPAHWPMRRLAMLSAARFYAEQAAALEEIRKKTGEDLFIPKHSLMQYSDGRMYSWTTWVDGVTNALMPQAEWVNLGSHGADGKAASRGFVPWTELMPVASSHLEPTDLYPPRFRVRTFPSADQLAKLNFRNAPGIGL